jgi:hypothetical protein
MGGDDAVSQPVVELWSAVYGDGHAAGVDDCVDQLSIGHNRDSNKAARKVVPSCRARFERAWLHNLPRATVEQAR